MINDIFGELVPNMDVEPIEPGCTCGCACYTRSAQVDTLASGSVLAFGTAASR